MIRIAFYRWLNINVQIIIVHLSVFHFPFFALVYIYRDDNNDSLQSNFVSLKEIKIFMLISRQVLHSNREPRDSKSSFYYYKDTF
jgi:hypothetical protein